LCCDGAMPLSKKDTLPDAVARANNRKFAWFNQRAKSNNKIED